LWRTISRSAEDLGRRTELVTHLEEPSTRESRVDSFGLERQHYPIGTVPQAAHIPADLRHWRRRRRRLDRAAAADQHRDSGNCPGSVGPPFTMVRFGDHDGLVSAITIDWFRRSRSIEFRKQPYTYGAARSAFSMLDFLRCGAVPATICAIEIR
jgi:hypothetical protein